MLETQFSDLATKELINAYLEMRKMGATSSTENNGSSGSKTIFATPRELESLVRLSDAIAKMILSTEVTRSDVRK